MYVLYIIITLKVSLILRLLSVFLLDIQIPKRGISVIHQNKKFFISKDVTFHKNVMY